LSEISDHFSVAGAVLISETAVNQSWTG